MKIAVISASLLLAAVSAQAAQTPSVAQSGQALASGLWSQSAALSEKALATPGLSSGDTVKALTTLCISQTKLGQFNDAWGTCDKAVAAGPTEWTSYINRGNLKAMLGYITSARADYARAQALNPASPVVKAAVASKYTRSMVTAPFVGLGVPGTLTAKGAGAAQSATAQ